jgi:endo-1,4-beta-mannosidase
VPVYTYELKPVDAEVLAVDESERPVFFRAKRGRGCVYVSAIPVELIEATAEYMEWTGKLQLLYKSLAREAGIPTVYETSSPEVEVKPFYGESGDIVIAVNHGEDKTTTITSSKPIESISKISGDAEVVSWSASSVELSMPRKSSIILHIESRGKTPLN